MQGTQVKVIALGLLLSVQLLAVDVVEEKAAPLFENEISSLEQLIKVNEKRLVAQKELKVKMERFKKQKEEFLLGNQSKSHTFSMVSTAREILVSVKEEHLSYLFATDYLEELLFFSSIAAKSVPIKP
jgi:hypothetical protein